MDDFNAMQAKVKQLIQIYKPAHSSPVASSAILVHTAAEANPKKHTGPTKK